MIPVSKIQNCPASEGAHPPQTLPCARKCAIGANALPNHPPAPIEDGSTKTKYETSYTGKNVIILVKMLSYQDKVAIMKSAREKMKDSTSYIIDDLTYDDLKEKKEMERRGENPV